MQLVGFIESHRPLAAIILESRMGNRRYDHGCNNQRHSLRRAQSTEAPGLHRNRGHHIGARHRCDTAIFSVVNAVLLRSLPYPHADRMVYVLEGKPSDGFEGSFSPQNFIDMRSRNHTFDSYTADNFVSFTVTGDQQPEAVNGVLASMISIV